MFSIDNNSSLPFQNQSRISNRQIFEKVEGEEFFADIYDTWTAFRNKWHEMWMRYFERSDGFSGHDFNRSENHSIAPTQGEGASATNLTPAQQRTLYAGLSIPLLVLFLLVLMCIWLYRRMRRRRVPPYLLSQFPLYEAAEESHTPMIERRTLSSPKLDHAVIAPQFTKIKGKRKTDV